MYAMLDEVCALATAEAEAEAAAAASATAKGQSRRGRNRTTPLPHGATQRSAARRCVPPFVSKLARIGVAYGLDTLLVVRQDDHTIVHGGGNMRELITPQLLDALRAPITHPAATKTQQEHQQRSVAPYATPPPPGYHIESVDGTDAGATLYLPGHAGVPFRLEGAGLPTGKGKQRRQQQQPPAPRKRNATTAALDELSGGSDDDVMSDDAEESYLYEELLSSGTLPLPALNAVELLEGSRTVAVTSATAAAAASSNNNALRLATPAGDSAADSLDAFSHAQLGDALELFSCLAGMLVD